jgi:hypothetical protein
VKNVKTLLTIIGTLMSGRTAINRISQAREDGDPWELLDAALNVAVVVTGLVVIVRRLRREQDA